MRGCSCGRSQKVKAHKSNIFGIQSILFKYIDLVRLGNEMCWKYGGVFRVWVGMLKVAFIISDARIAELVLGHSHKYLAKSDIYSFLVPWLGNGLLLSNGDKWRSRRKAITPAFHFKILEEFVEIFDRQSDVLVGKLAQVATGEVINVYSYVSLMSLDNICGRSDKEKEIV